MGKPMWQGIVVSLHIVSEKSQPMVTVETIRAIPGLGLEGDVMLRAEALTPTGQRKAGK